MWRVCIIFLDGVIIEDVVGVDEFFWRGSTEVVTSWG